MRAATWRTGNLELWDPRGAARGGSTRARRCPECPRGAHSGGGHGPPMARRRASPAGAGMRTKEEGHAGARENVRRIGLSQLRTNERRTRCLGPEGPSTLKRRLTDLANVLRQSIDAPRPKRSSTSSRSLPGSKPLTVFTRSPAVSAVWSAALSTHPRQVADTLWPPAMCARKSLAVIHFIAAYIPDFLHFGDHRC